MSNSSLKPTLSPASSVVMAAQQTVFKFRIFWSLGHILQEESSQELKFDTSSDRTCYVLGELTQTIQLEMDLQQDLLIPEIFGTLIGLRQERSQQ